VFAALADTAAAAGWFLVGIDLGRRRKTMKHVDNDTVMTSNRNDV
jgi:hypothetical protein